MVTVCSNNLYEGDDMQYVRLNQNQLRCKNNIRNRPYKQKRTAPHERKILRSQHFIFPPKQWKREPGKQFREPAYDLSDCCRQCKWTMKALNKLIGICSGTSQAEVLRPLFSDRIRIRIAVFWGRRKTGEPGEKPSEQGEGLQRTQPTNDARPAQDSNPGHIVGRWALLTNLLSCSSISNNKRMLKSN